MNKDDPLYQSLIDSKCTEEFASECMALSQDGQNVILLRKLSKQRSALLDSIHAEQKALSNLDYLIFQIRKGEKNYV